MTRRRVKTFSRSNFWNTHAWAVAGLELDINRWADGKSTDGNDVVIVSTSLAVTWLACYAMVVYYVEDGD